MSILSNYFVKRIAFFYGLRSKWEFVAKSVICYSVFTQHDIVSARCNIYPLGKNWRSSLIRFTLDDSICITHEIFNNIVTRTKIVFEESAILPANSQNQKWKCRLRGVQETKCQEFYNTGHGKAPFQPWWSVRGAMPTFDVNRCILAGLTFCFCLLRQGLAVTGARAENFGTRLHSVNQALNQQPDNTLKLNHAYELHITPGLHQARQRNKA